MLEKIKNNIDINISSSNIIDSGMSQETYKIKDNSGNRYFVKYTTDCVNQERMYQCHIYQSKFVPDNIKKPELVESEFTSEYSYTIQKYYNSIKSHKYFNNKSFLINTVEDLGSIVKLLQNSNPNNLIKYDRDVEKMVSDAMKYTRKSGYNKYLSVINDAKEQLEKSNKEQVFSHRDLHIDNLLLNHDGSINYIVDWEHCRWTNPMYDLAKIEIRFLDKFDGIDNFCNNAPTLREKLRSSYGKENINYGDLYAIKILHGLRTIGRIRTKEEAYYPWSQILSRKDIEDQYKNNIHSYIDKFNNKM